MTVRRAPARPRASYHHGDLRRALVDATIQMLAEAGPDVLSLREVARRVGVDHRAAYRHFQDKEALFAAVAEEGYRDLVATVRRDLSRIPAGDVLPRLRDLARAYTRFAAEHPGHSDIAREVGGAALQEGVADPWAKEELRARSEAAIARGLFGVPTFVVGDEIFWGHDRMDYVKRAAIDA